MTPPTSIVLFCDDLRAEISNKISVMGLYAEGLSFDVPPPFVLSKLCGMVWVMCKRDSSPPFISIRVTIPPGRIEVFSNKLAIDRTRPVEEDGEVKNVRYGTYFALFNLQLTAPGYIEAFVDAGSGEERAGRLKLLFPDTPSAG